MGEPELAQLVAPGERLADRGRHRLRALRVAADSRVTRGLVERRMRRGDNRCTARHRLRDRHPEPLEARWVDDRRGTAIEARELGVADAAEPVDAGPVERRLVAPAGAADDREPKSRVVEQPEGLDQRPEVLARLERRDGEEVGAARPAGGPSSVNSSPMPGCATTMRSRGNSSVPAVSSAVNAELAKITLHVRAAFVYLRECIARVRGVTHSGKCSGTRSWIVVARMPARCGGYIQSVKCRTSKAPRNLSAGGQRDP